VLEIEGLANEGLANEGLAIEGLAIESRKHSSKGKPSQSTTYVMSYRVEGADADVTVLATFADALLLADFGDSELLGAWCRRYPYLFPCGLLERMHARGFPDPAKLELWEFLEDFNYPLFLSSGVSFTKFVESVLHSIGANHELADGWDTREPCRLTDAELRACLRLSQAVWMAGRFHQPACSVHISTEDERVFLNLYVPDEWISTADGMTAVLNAWTYPGCFRAEDVAQDPEAAISSVPRIVRSARMISRAWRRSIADPVFAICRKRLRREFEEDGGMV
jgi:hypothetical protein